MKFNIPEEIINIAEKLQKSNFQAYLVGGCVRDLIMNREPKDWDIATDAKPEEIQKIFSRRKVGTPTKTSEPDYDSAYENVFGTVAIKTRSENPKLKIIEITTFRLEGKYTDKRHPDEIKFAKTVEEDLARRDFTINAMAFYHETWNLKHETEKKENSCFMLHDSCFKIIDPFGGQVDIKNKIIRTVGNPEERFNEDALRLMRAVRFATELNFSAKGGPPPKADAPREQASGWKIEKKTSEAIKKQSGLLEMIAKERICEELKKILMTRNAVKGVQTLEDLGLLRYVMPELREGINVGQNKHHIYTVWEHNLRALDYAAKKDYSLEIRMAALLHDVGKPETKAGDGPDSTFYNHEVVGAKIAMRILDRLHFSKNFIEKTVHLVRYHLFYYNVGEVTEAGVRRFLRRVGPENVEDFIKLREADRIGSGVPKAVPYKLRHLLFMIEKVKRDPLSPKMLKISGKEVMEILGIEPGPKIGWILSILLDEVLEEPDKNSSKYLVLRIKELGNLSDVELEKLSKSAREKKDEFESGAEEEIKKKFYVR